MHPLAPLGPASNPTFWQQNGTILLVAGLIALLALGLLITAWLSSRSAVRPLPPEPSKKPEEKAPEAKAAPPPKPPKVKEAPPPPGPELSAEERRRLKEEEEERKRAAYRARKEQ